MNAKELAGATKENIRRRAELEQRTAALVEKLKADPGTDPVLRVVMADWDENGACTALGKYPKEVHAWIRILAGWALMYLSLEAMEHIVQDKEAESEAAR